MTLIMLRLLGAALVAALVPSAAASVDVAVPGNSMVIDAPRPVYPPDARRDRITGSGVATITVDPKSGRVASAKMSQSTGSRILDKAALSAFRRWRFKPGAPVAVVNLPVSFTLAGSGAANVIRVAGFGNVPNEAIQSLLAATTPGGKTLSAGEVRPLIVSAPLPKRHMRVVGYVGLKIGVFLLSVRSDGTVAKVEVLQSAGAAIVDNEIKSTFLKWRFRPNSVTEVRVPAYYNRG